MAEPRNWHVVAYDIRDDRRMRRVHKLLRAWGRPVQFSLFRVRGTDRELARLQFELSKVMDSDDRLLLVRLCGGCASQTVVKGPPIEPFELQVEACTVC